MNDKMFTALMKKYDAEIEDAHDHMTGIRKTLEFFDRFVWWLTALTAYIRQENASKQYKSVLLPFISIRERD